jgi:ferritin-like metal-binding protein YciE
MSGALQWDEDRLAPTQAGIFSESPTCSRPDFSGSGAALFFPGSTKDITMNAKNELLIQWLRDAHAMERATIDNIEILIERFEKFPVLGERYRAHLAESHEQLERIDAALAIMQADASTIKDSVMRLTAKIQPMLATAAEDEPIKNMMAAYAFENFQIAAYLALIEAARMCGKTAIMRSLGDSLREEQAMSEFLETCIVDITRLYLSEEQKEKYYAEGPAG